MKDSMNRNIKTYLLLGGLIILSIGVGAYAFLQDTEKNILSNKAYAMKELENDEQLEQTNTDFNGNISVKDIISKNKVITEKMIQQDEKLAYETVTLGSRSGNSKVLTEGSNGIQKNLYKVRYEDDVEVSKMLVSSVVKTKPTNKVIQYETSNSTISRDGTEIIRKDENESLPVAGYTKVIEMKFTSYCLCKKCTGKSPGDKGYGVTASGYVITPGKNQKVVAVDPKVIPLGSKVYVQGIGVKDYGYAIAADTGGAIKGNKIDLYVDSHGSSPWWTVGKVKVYVYE